MPVILSEAAYVTDWLKWEEDDRFSRDEVVVAVGQNLKRGAVVGVTGAGQLSEYDNTTIAVAVGIIVEPVDATTVARRGVILTRNAHIIASPLVWKTGLAAADKTAALTDLVARGVIVRPEA